MCKHVTLMVKDQIINTLSCHPNGVKSKMNFSPSSNVLSLSSDMLSNVELKPDDGSTELVKLKCEKEWNTFHDEDGISNESQEEAKTYKFFQQRRLENAKNNKPFNTVQEDSLVDNSCTINENLEENLICSLRPDSKAVVDNLIEKINNLSSVQKMLLYLKLPSPRDDPDQLDPLRRPLNPLGNRQEVSQALAYIRTHFLPNPDVSLPKKEIYNDYVTYCSSRKIKPLSTADFGKAMKQVYPVVRPRRLGERGNSRYCYSGLCNRDVLDKPRTSSGTEARDAASRKICGWASKILNVKVNNLTELSTIISSDLHSNVTDQLEDKSGGGVQTVVPKKLQEKKRKIELESTQTVERSSKKKKTSDQHICKSEKTNGSKSLKHSLSSPCAQGLQGKTEATVNAGPSNVCDIINQKQIDVDVLKIKRLVVNSLDLKPEKSTNLGKKKKTANGKIPTLKKTRRQKRNKISPMGFVDCGNKIYVKKETQLPLSTEKSFTIASIEENPLLELRSNKNLIKEKPDDLINGSQRAVVTNDNVCDNFKNNKTSTDASKTQDCDHADIYNDIGYLTAEGLCHYLQDEGNSQEPEEELLKYFKDAVKSEPKSYNHEKDTSQLRMLLEQNVPEELSVNYKENLSERDTGFSEEDSVKMKEIDFNSCFTSPQGGSQHFAQKSSFLSNLQGISSKRRVSFENIPDSFPQSPTTHRKNFSFAPISPRPPTISKPILSISPFVFPRETPLRGKLSITNNSSNLQQTPIPSPVTQIHLSPLKGSSRSTSLSSTPSPITSGHSSSSAVHRGRSTPQDVVLDHADSLKSSPLISPSSSSGVFLSPASPMSSCNSPIFSFRKNMSPIKHSDDSKSSAKSNSLLQALLLTGKCPETKQLPSLESITNTPFESVHKNIKPLAVDIYQYSNEPNLSSFRSQSVPTTSNSIIVSPSSNTLPFPSYLSKNKENSALLEIKPNELDELDSVFDGIKSSEDHLLVENMSDNDTLESSIQTVGNEVSMESVISNLCDFLNDKGLSNTNENIKVPLVSRSHPNTPLLYSESSNSSRDPVVSAFPVSSASKSYPSTPTVCTTRSFNGITASINSSTKRNIIPILDSISNPITSLSDDIELHLNNFADLSGCDDAFNQLAREVASSNVEKEIQE